MKALSINVEAGCDDDPCNEETIAELNTLGEYDRNTGVLSVVITGMQYEIADDDPKSLISKVLEIAGNGCVAEWTDYYEPREDGRTDAAINIKAKVG